MKHLLSFSGFCIETGMDWVDITDTVDSPNKPFSAAKREGVGALQFSPALYRGGPLASPGKDDLLGLAVEFGENRSLGEPFDAGAFEEPLVGAAASYHDDDNFIRVWYLSDKKNIMLVTYVCEWGYQHRELAECEDIIRSLQFDVL